MPEAAEVDQEDKPVAPPPVSAGPVTPSTFAAAMRLPTTTADVGRAPGVPSPAPSPAALAPLQWVKRAQPPIEPTNPPAFQTTEQAVSAALEFQGRRGYMNDIQNGVPPATAMAKWASLIFHRPPTAAELRVDEPVIIHSGNQIFRVKPSGGPAEALTQAPAAKDAYELARFQSFLRRQREIESEISKDPDNIDNASKRKEIKRLDEEANKIAERNKPAAAPSAPTAPATTAPPPPAFPHGKTFIGPKRITTQAQWDALKPGEIYVDEKGKKFRKE